MSVNLRVLINYIKISPELQKQSEHFPPGGDRTHDLLHARLLRIPHGQLGLKLQKCAIKMNILYYLKSEKKNPRRMPIRVSELINSHVLNPLFLGTI